MSVKLTTTLPKDKSQKIYFDDTGRELQCTKPLLVYYESPCPGDPPKCDIAQYVHTRKEWVETKLGFGIYSKIIGWIDPMQLINENHETKK